MWAACLLLSTKSMSEGGRKITFKRKQSDLLLFSKDLSWTQDAPAERNTQKQ